MVPRDGDVLQIGSDAALTLPARSSGVFEATILTSMTSYTGHEVSVTWYQWGRPFSLTATCNN